MLKKVGNYYLRRHSRIAGKGEANISPAASDFFCEGCHARFPSESELCATHLLRGVCPRLCAVEHEHRLLVLEFDSFRDARQALRAKVEAGGGAGWSLLASQCHQVRVAATAAVSIAATTTIKTKTSTTTNILTTVTTTTTSTVTVTSSCPSTTTTAAVATATAITTMKVVAAIARDVTVEAGLLTKLTDCSSSSSTTTATTKNGKWVLGGPKNVHCTYMSEQ